MNYPELFLLSFAIVTVSASNQIQDPYESFNVLQRPGNCVAHSGYPNNSIQCAHNKERCITLDQLHDGNNDCCDDPSNCDDTSDEDRITPPGNCTIGANTSTLMMQAINVKLTMQCAKTKLCLLRTEQPNGVCECCGPDHDCSTCDDHSDEDPCKIDEWTTKFSCEGKCMQWYKFNDSSVDCPFSCIETAVKDKCLQERASALQTSMAEFCAALAHHNTPHFNCTSELKCITAKQVRNGHNDCSCEGAEVCEDDDPSKHPDCDEATKSSQCSDDTTLCIKINGGDYVECRCPAVNRDDCFKNGNKRRRRKK